MGYRVWSWVLCVGIGGVGLVGCGDDDSTTGGTGGALDAGRDGSNVGTGGIGRGGGGVGGGGGGGVGGGGGGVDGGTGGSGQGGSGQGGADGGLDGSASLGGSADGSVGADASAGDGGVGGNVTVDASAEGATGVGGASLDSGAGGVDSGGYGGRIDAGEGDDASRDASEDASADAPDDNGDAELDAPDALDASLAIEWNAYLPLSGGIVADGGQGISLDVTSHHYDATYSSDITFAGSTMVFGSAGTRLVSIGPQSGAPVIDLTASYSISVWITMTDTSGWRTFVSADGTIASEFYLQKRDNTGKLAFTVGYADSNEGVNSPCIAAASTTPLANTLYHLVATRDAVTGLDILYVNGAEAGRATCLADAGVGWPASTFGVGHGMYGGGKVDLFSGSMSGLGFVNRVLTPAEVAAIYSRGFTYTP